MKKNAILLSILFTATIASAQVSNYRFSALSGTYTPVDSMPGLAVNTYGIQDDFITPDKVKLPFSFQFGQQQFDSVGLSENGFLYFGNIGNRELGSSWPISTVHTSKVKGVISPIGTDLHPVNTAPQNTTLKTTIAGTAPNRIFIAEWAQTSRFDAVNNLNDPDNISFQVKLYEQSNRIDFVYGSFTLNPALTEPVEIGLKGATYDDYVNRIPNGPDWMQTLPGNTQLGRLNLNETSMPARGTTFSWTTGGGTNMEDVRTDNSWTVFPVPSAGELFLSLPVAESATYRITDVSGRLVLGGTCGSFISIASLQPGTYYLHLKGRKLYAPKMIVKL